MKKMFVIFCVLVLTLAFPVLAVTTTPLPSPIEIPVTATYQEIANTDTVYSVDIIWGSMDFTYQVQNGSWDPETHSYSTSSSGTWANPVTGDNNLKSNQLKITNHSNAAVAFSIEYTPNDSYSNISALFSFDGSKGDPSITDYSLPTAVKKTQTDPSLTKTFDLSLIGPLPETASSTPIGTITITLSEV